MQRRIFRSIFLTALAAVIIVGIFTAASFYSIFDNRVVAELRVGARAVASALSHISDVNAYLDAVQDGHRLTLISPDGSVIYDSMVDASSMENHLDRPEIAEAIESGEGESRRYSNTLTQKNFYYAVRMDDGKILRISVTERSILGIIHRVIFPLIAFSLFVAFLSLVLSRMLARHITEPIGKIDLSSPLNNDVYDELSPLLLRLENQNDTLRDQLAELERQRHELAAITENMSEGLLMLNMDAQILSINNSALKIFGANRENCLGRSVLSVNRSPELHDIVTAAQKGEEGERILSLGGHVYQLLSTPVRENADRSPGIVVLLLDVTDRYEAENNRREFTANVSHELRTPLTSIAGYSEIMASGLAKSEDMRDFARKINDESKRLIALVNDIIELSRLDENASAPKKECIDLYTMCSSIVDRIKPLATKKDISVELTGGHIAVWGVGRLIDEMVYNLVDNAVKYNKVGGSINIKLEDFKDKTTLSVSDTGIGIPIEHQGRVFERFYRVDKSHSKETGGTGLGLAIAKHAAAVNNARITLKSTVGEGSCFTVIFTKDLHTAVE